jgi:hypothetical protein
MPADVFPMSLTVSKTTPNNGLTDRQLDDVKLLLEEGADVNAEGGYFSNAL